MWETTAATVSVSRGSIDQILLRYGRADGLSNVRNTSETKKGSTMFGVDISADEPLGTICKDLSLNKGNHTKL